MKIAFLQLYKLRDHYHFDTFHVLCAGDLRRAGHEVEVVTYTFDRATDEDAELDRVRAYLASRGVELCFVDRAWRRGVVRAIAASGARVASLLAPAALAWPEVELLVRLPRRATVRELVDRLARGAALEGIPDLCFRQGAELCCPPPSPRVSMRQELGDLVLDYQCCVDLTPERPPPELRKHVVGNWGCAYRTAPNRSGFLSGLALPLGVVATGCTFCDRAAYQPASVEETLELEMQQLAQLRAHFPNVAKVVVIDEFGLRYVDRFAREATRRGYHGTYLWSGRPDHVLRWSERIARAAQQAPRSRQVLYCIGIESFSDAELARMNKGLCAADLFRALGELDRLQAAHPNVLVEDSFGFILLTPWTTVEDLRANVAAFRRIGFERFRAAAVDTWLRLYPQTGLYHRARQDGLLLATTPDDGHADEYGYEADAPWRFADPEVAEIARQLAGTRGQARLRRLEALLRGR